MKIPAHLTLMDLQHQLHGWSQGMRFLVDNLTPLHFTEDIAKRHKAGYDSHLSSTVREAHWKGQYKWLEAMLHEKSATPTPTRDAFFTPRAKKATAARTALITEIKANLPLCVEWSEADGTGGYLVLAEDNVIGIGDYQPPARTLNDMSTSHLALLNETYVSIADLQLPESVTWIAKEMGLALPTTTKVLGRSPTF